jgi:osmoprotectant transport system permease protein
MELFREVILYIRDNPERFREAVFVHIRLSATALFLGMAIFIPLGIISSRTTRVGPALVGAVSSLRVLPSLAIIFLLYPWLGTGFQPALIALTILAGPALVINTDAALRNVSPSVREAAVGLGMNIAQAFARVELPLALSVIVAGVRTAAVEVIASATLAAFIGAGGLGAFITSGLTLLDTRLLLVGAIPVAALALTVELFLSGVERLVSPPRA